MNKLLITLLSLSLSASIHAQSLKNSIEGSDIWGAWLVKGTSKVWLVDEIPERARLWDYENNEVVVSFKMKENVKSINLLDNGSLAYITHHEKNEYIILNESGNTTVKKIKNNAPYYYIHPGGKYAFGSIFEGFVTYTIGEKKISESKLNDSITDYTSRFYQTGSPEVIFRRSNDVFQKIDIYSDGVLAVSRAYDKGLLLFDESKNHFLLVSPKSYTSYSLTELQSKTTFDRSTSIDLYNALYNSEDQTIWYCKDGSINRFDLKIEKDTNSVFLDVGDLYFEDRMGNTAIGFSNKKQKFFVIEL
ncbi:hypothetical protein [Reichenbachiella sp. MALMAid0571]|uniref:hypothetical protein n=1 Tax=Reichenbachiella sp. MALMAid0571 TaxID=3143939 RepID=UPI0032DF119C